MAVDDSYTKSLLHFNGVDASTTFTDESGKTWTPAADAQIDTAQSKFGGASGLFDGTGDYIETSDHDDFNINDGDWTIDFWMRPHATPASYFSLFGHRGAAGDISIYCNLDASRWLAVTIKTSVSQFSITYSSALSVDTWYHVAIVRDSAANLIRFFVGGTSRGTYDITGLTLSESAAKLVIGRYGESASYYYNGWIDEFRWSKGIARWTSNFTPPVAEYAPVVYEKETADDFSIADDMDGYTLTQTLTEGVTIADDILGGFDTEKEQTDGVSFDDSIVGGFEIEAVQSDDLSLDDSVSVTLEYFLYDETVGIADEIEYIWEGRGSTFANYLPMFEISAKSGYNGVLTESIPFFSLSVIAGQRIELTEGLIFKHSGTGWSVPPLRTSAYVPRLKLSAKSGVLGSMTLNAPSLSATSVTVSNLIAAFSAPVPSFEIEGYANSRFNDYILSHVR